MFHTLQKEVELHLVWRVSLKVAVLYVASTQWNEWCVYLQPRKIL